MSTPTPPLEVHVHPALGEEVRAIGGRYELTEERIVPFAGRDLLVDLGVAEVDASCCGVAGGAFAVVAGYVAALRFATGASGSALSRVERVTDERTQRAIRSELQAELGEGLRVTFR